MAVSLSGDFERCDVLVVGAGLAGLVAAIGFARAGLLRRLLRRGRAARPGPHGGPARPLDRLPRASRRLATTIEPSAAPLRALRIVDDTGSLFPPRPVEFRAEEIGLDAFGWNIENAPLADALALAAAAAPEPAAGRGEGRELRFRAASALWSGSPTDGDSRRALVVGADGRGSSARKAAGVEARTHSLSPERAHRPLAHTRPHEDYSTEFHTRQGPFTLVPLPAAPGARMRSSLVWVMSHAEAARRAALDDGRSPARSRTRRVRSSARCGSRANAACSRWRARA